MLYKNMQQEKYSRQIRLFGESTQKRIEESHIHIISRAERNAGLYIERLLQQMGAGVCICPETCEQIPTWIFACDLAEPLKCTEKDLNVFYISTADLTISKDHAAPNIQVSDVFCEEYINILAGVAVQEYIKALSGIELLNYWKLDTAIFE